MDVNEQTKKINKPQICFFGNINATDKPLSRLIRENQCTHIRNERRDTTTDTIYFKHIIRIYFDKLDGNKLNNLDEMEKFLEKCNVAKWI